MLQHRRMVVAAAAVIATGLTTIVPRPAAAALNEAFITGESGVDDVVFRAVFDPTVAGLGQAYDQGHAPQRACLSAEEYCAFVADTKQDAGCINRFRAVTGWDFLPCVAGKRAVT